MPGCSGYTLPLAPSSSGSTLRSVTGLPTPQRPQQLTNAAASSVRNEKPATKGLRPRSAAAGAAGGGSCGGLGPAAAAAVAPSPPPLLALPVAGGGGGGE